MSSPAELAQSLADRFGLNGNQFVETGTPGLKIIHQDSYVPRAPIVYNSGVFILLKGRKLGHLGARTFEYSSENYVAVGLPFAMECETVASKEDPLIAIYLSVDLVVLRNVASAMAITIDAADSENVAFRTAPLSGEMYEAIARLVRFLSSEDDMAVLGTSLVREVIYRVLQGPAGPALYGLLNGDSQTARIASIMQTLNTRLSEKITVDEMAHLAGMSSSAFHRAFREVADDTPLQYLKKVRLARASALMATENYRVGMAASAVGYESAAQFSRDFKNHFGLPPADARKLGYAFVRAHEVG